MATLPKSTVDALARALGVEFHYMNEKDLECYEDVSSLDQIAYTKEHIVFILKHDGRMFAFDEDTDESWEWVMEKKV